MFKFKFYGVADYTGHIMDLWAMEALVRLEEVLITSAMFNRDYEQNFADFGETLNVRQLGTFDALRLTQGDPVTKQYVSSTTQQVKLNQHVYVAVPFDDRDINRTFDDIVNIYVAPAVRGIGEKVDAICDGQKYNSLAYSAGAIGTALSYANGVALGQVFDENNNPMEQRSLIVNPGGKANLLNEDKFTTYEKLGNGQRLVNGMIGAGFGFDTAMSQMNRYVASKAAVIPTGAVNGALLEGATAIVVDGITGSVPDDQWCTIAGVPYQIASASDTAGDTTGLVLVSGLREDVADNAVIKFYDQAAVNLVAGYASGYDGTIVYNGYISGSIPVGAGVSFGANRTVYGVIKATSTTIELNRPLEAAVAHSDTINVLPAGNYNFAMRPGANTLVVKPMAPPAPGSGVAASSLFYNGLGLRMTLGYNQEYMRTMFVIDTLVGVKTLDAAQAGVFLA